jgi:hypothetical protein
MKRIKHIFFLPVMAAVLVTGCKKQIETAPKQSIPAETALSSKESIDASITGIYARLKGARQYGRDLIALPEALADNGYATNNSGRLVPESNNTFGAANHFTGTLWSNSFAALNQINLTLEAIPQLKVVPAPTAAEIARWEGQLYFLRGLYYFDLVKVYAYMPGAVVASQNKGGVPLLITSVKDLSVAIKYLPARAPIDSVYKQVVSDLTNANSRLTFSSTADVGVANKAAAQGLLARVNLYRKDYAEAKRWADSCINLTNPLAAGSTGKLSSTGSYVADWRTATHRETLFHVRYASNAENIGVNESLQTSFTTLGSPGVTAVTVGFGDLVPTITLLNDLGITLTGGNTSAVFTGSNASIASRSTDVRNLVYEPGTAGRSKAYVECTKYLGKNGFPNLDNVVVLRISELYLTRAEAQYFLGVTASALADLKVIKSNRYASYTGSAIETADNALTGQALMDEIMRQRRIELAFEGHRFFDLKRNGMDIVKSLPSTAVVPFTDVRILPAIPQVDIDANPNLKQNTGY